MSASTAQLILENAEYHSRLTQYYDSLQNAISDLRQQVELLEGLEKELETVKAKVEKLATRTRFERKNHEKTRDSTARRFAASMMENSKVKYELKKEKEEREYVEALEREVKERVNLERIETEILKARIAEVELNEKTNEINNVKRELRSLYERIFDGPTPDFPRDDELKDELKFAQATHRQIQGQVDNHLQVAELLQQAWRELYHCSEALHTALENSTHSTLPLRDILPIQTNEKHCSETGGGRLTTAEGRKALEKAVSNASEAQKLVSQAQSLSPDETYVGDIHVRNNSHLFTEAVALRMDAYKRAKANREELQTIQQRVKEERRAANSRAKQVADDLIEAAEVISQCQEALMEHRRVTAERVVE
ncbi:hypothetical protein WG66_010156 [Moniliophthora roreri]|nr:hypothetical protein WG66_010156 [Moniliophthora roreri]